jgi:hypothetical protein
MTTGTTTLQTQIVTVSAPGWSVPLSFDQFDPSLGTLSDVDVGLVGTITGSAAIENLGASAASLQISLPGNIDVTASDSTVLATVDPVATTTLNLGAYDGTANFTGSSGTVVSGFANTATTVSDFVPASGGGVPFVGTGSIDLTASGQASSSITAGGNLLSLTEGQTGATVSVQYGATPGGSGSTAGSGLFSFTWSDFPALYPPADLQTTTVQTLRIADTTTGWNAAVAAAQFNPTLGTLEAINLTVVTDVNAGLAVENLGSAPGSVGLTETADVTVALPGGLGTVINTPSIDASTYLAAFDGTIDFGGLSGANLTGLTATQTTTSTFTGYNGDLSAFVGTGTVGLPVAAISPSTLTGPADLAAELLTEAGATIEISYTYIPSYTNIVASIGSTVAAGAAPAISGSQAGQGVTDQTTVAPLANVLITDPNAAQTETVTVTQSAAANGTLTNLGGGSYDATTGVYTVTGSAAAVTAALDRLVFIPNADAVAPNQSLTTGFTITDTDTAGVTVTDTTTSVVATTGVFIDTATVAAEIKAELDKPAVAPTISGTEAGQAISDRTTITPFYRVTIGDANFGQTETVTVKLLSPANGTLTGLDGGSYNPVTGIFTDTGSAATVTNAVDALLFTPTAGQVAPGQTVTTQFTITDADSAGATTTDATSSVVATASWPPLSNSVTPAPVLGSGTGSIGSGSFGASSWQNVTITADSLGIGATGPDTFIGGFGADGIGGTIASSSGSDGRAAQRFYAITHGGASDPTANTGTSADATIPGITAGDFTAGLGDPQGTAGSVGSGGSFNALNQSNAFPVMSAYADTNLANFHLTVPS